MGLGSGVGGSGVRNWKSNKYCWKHTNDSKLVKDGSGMHFGIILVVLVFACLFACVLLLLVRFVGACIYYYMGALSFFSRIPGRQTQKEFADVF